MIGACGWQYPQWDISYYPESLPEEWRLAYYGNEYPVVLLPADYWLQGRDVVDSWLAETAERPGFICEWIFSQEHPSQAELREGILSLGERVEGILVSLQTKPDTAQLSEIRSLAASYVVWLDWPGAESEQLHEVIREFGLAQSVGICWHGDTEFAELLDYGRMSLARVMSEGQSPRSLRSLLETLLAKAGNRQAVLLFDGEPPDLDIVDQAEVILNLL